MNFRTQVHIPKANFQVTHNQNLMLFGSCFSENIGLRLLQNKFNANVNPFGILYNPLSVSTAVRRLTEKKSFTEDDLVYHNDVYQSFLHHGKFSDSDKETCLKKITASFENAVNFIHKTDVFLITFGTAYIYRLKSSGQVVGNCHKFTADHFIRERLSVEEIVKDWSELIENLLSINPAAKFIFTVSPIRHLKDGMHENHISKATLLLAIEQLKTRFGNSIDYFCAYELLLDELRDYRFYADDMIHPSETAIEYIWQKFSATYFPEETIRLLTEWSSIQKALEHKPLNEKSESYNRFLQQTLQKLANFEIKYSEISCQREKDLINEKIKQLHL